MNTTCWEKEFSEKKRKKKAILQTLKLNWQCYQNIHEPVLTSHDIKNDAVSISVNEALQDLKKDSRL